MKKRKKNTMNKNIVHVKKISDNPAIVVIAFDRINSLRRVLKSIENAHYPNLDIPLIISIDYNGSKKNKEVIEYAKKYVWENGHKEVRIFKENQGLKQHFLKCGDYSEIYGSAIILEDDVIVSDSFYSYTMQAVNYYAENKKVLAISLYGQLWDGYATKPFEPMAIDSDVYASQIECSWGECYIGSAWKEFRRWQAINDGKLKKRNDVPETIYTWNHSYSKYVINYIVEMDKWFITPYRSLSSNFSDVGTHVLTSNSAYQVPMVWSKRNFSFKPFDDLKKYDIFFQPIDLEEHFEKILGEPTVSDLFGIRNNYEEYRYCISSAILPYKRVLNFGLELRPWELNCYQDIQGNDFFV